MFWVGVSAVVAAAASTLLLLLHLPVELLECVVVLALERGSAWFLSPCSSAWLGPVCARLVRADIAVSAGSSGHL